MKAIHFNRNLPISNSLRKTPCTEALENFRKGGGPQALMLLKFDPSTGPPKLSDFVGATTIPGSLQIVGCTVKLGMANSLPHVRHLLTSSAMTNSL